METFYSIQGEGFYTGTPSYFIRTGGCDVGCSWCDVKESWNAKDHAPQNVSDIVDGAAESMTKVVIVTGGEPTMYDLNPLCEELSSRGLRKHLETSGVYPISGTWDWICFSPKKFKAPLDDVYDKCHELKIVVLNKHDLKWAEEHAAKVNGKCKLFLQPEWDKSDVTLPLILNYIKENPKWNLSLQTHKFIGVR